MKRGVDISQGSSYLLVNKNSHESFYPGKKRLCSNYLLVNKYWGGYFFRGVNICGDTAQFLKYLEQKFFQKLPITLCVKEIFPGNI